MIKSSMRHALAAVIGLATTSLVASEWRKVETPHFTVLAQGGIASAREWATNL